MSDALKFVRRSYYKKPRLKSGNAMNAKGGPAEAGRMAKVTLDVASIGPVSGSLRLDMTQWDSDVYVSSPHHDCLKAVL
ncbi:hypothetical protein [Xanthomonas fragariae]|uniref:hypothetical protein n=1 Tax=Xanthomonas fragariae TaxID=48664 RepID=UPI00131EF444|nr:hypothetical protein [Xanthomonas fragariae]